MRKCQFSATLHVRVDTEQQIRHAGFLLFGRWRLLACCACAECYGSACAVLLMLRVVSMSYTTQACKRTEKALPTMVTPGGLAIGRYGAGTTNKQRCLISHSFHAGPSLHHHRALLANRAAQAQRAAWHYHVALSLTLPAAQASAATSITVETGLLSTRRSC
jgi:hypothetical protein